MFSNELFDCSVEMNGWVLHLGLRFWGRDLSKKTVSRRGFILTRSCTDSDSSSDDAPLDPSLGISLCPQLLRNR